MNVHFYRIPSEFRNIDDKIVIKSSPMESYSGEWLHAETPLPNGYRVQDTEYGGSFIVTDTGEIITTVYAGLPKIEGNVIRSYIYGGTGQILNRLWVEWR